MKTFSKIVILLLVSSGLTSCLKDDNIDNQEYGMINLNANKIVEVTAASSSSALPFENVDKDLTVLTLHLAAESPTTEDVVVTLSLAQSQAMITAYNTANATAVAQLPADFYKLPAGGLAVTIPKGTTAVPFTIKVNTSKFNPAITYALGLTIASVDKPGYTVSGNFGKTLARVSAKNIYDGRYSYSGTTIRNSANGPDVTLSGFNANFPVRSLATVGANSVTIVPLWANGQGIAGIDNTIATVDPTTNLVTMSSSNATLKNTPGKVNKYDPATKTFTLSFDWLGATPADTRIVEMVLKYTGVR